MYNAGSVNNKTVSPAQPDAVAAGVDRQHAQQALISVISRPREPVIVVRENSTGALHAKCDRSSIELDKNKNSAFTTIGILPPLYPEWLGDRAFSEVHGCRFPYVVGEMARGLTTAKMVVAAVRGGLAAFFGSAGLSLQEISEAIDYIHDHLHPTQQAWGANLIHSPNEPGLETATIDLFLQKGVMRISASAFMALSPAVVRYACKGLALDDSGTVVRKHHVFAKVSRPELARHFMSPPPAAMLRELLACRAITEQEASLASKLPVAEDITVEADSGGHTDNRPLSTLFPVLVSLRDTLTEQYRYPRSIRLGAAGGLGTPSALASAFTLGAAYVVTGSVNQACVESGLSEHGRQLLAGADIADVAMAPAADMFERGIKVQVLKKGTLFHTRAASLYELYKSCGSIEQIPAPMREKLEKEVFRAPLNQIWASTREYFLNRQTTEVERAERDPRHLMALVFRWYLFNASRWPAQGETARQADYQIWCGPAMGAFNDWVRGSFLQPIENRTVVQVAYNLLEGAAIITRASQLRNYGLAVPASAFNVSPRLLA